jgi:hypothetical protein
MQGDASMSYLVQVLLLPRLPVGALVGRCCYCRRWLQVPRACPGPRQCPSQPCLQLLNLHVLALDLVLGLNLALLQLLHPKTQASNEVVGSGRWCWWCGMWLEQGMAQHCSAVSKLVIKWCRSSDW